MLDREAWLARSAHRRQADFVERHVHGLRVTASKPNLRKFEHVAAGVAAHRAGGQQWQDFSRSFMGTTASQRLLASSRSQPVLFGLPPPRVAPELPSNLAASSGYAAAKQMMDTRRPAPAMPGSVKRGNTFSRAADMRSNEVKKVEQAIAERFKSMANAFKFMDIDQSGTLTENEIRRALNMWKIDMDTRTLRELMAQCDQDASGAVDYNEFVDVLARNTAGSATLMRGPPAHAA